MATKTLTITEEAYKRLAGRKKEKESFSDVINREFGKVNLEDFFGLWSQETAEKIENNIEKIREIRKKADKKRIERMKKTFK